MMDDILEFQCTSCGTNCSEGAARLQVTENDTDLWQEQAAHILKFLHLNVRKGHGTSSLQRSKLMGLKA